MTIPSFTIDHTKLLEGVYVSRKDETPSGDTITTLDVRIKRPNTQMADPRAMHTIEHLGATFLRNSEWKSKVIYFGPMGCMTGCYLILNGNYESHQVITMLQSMFLFIRDYKGEVIGATKKECGNASFHSLRLAKYEAGRYLSILNNITAERLSYPK